MKNKAGFLHCNGKAFMYPGAGYFFSTNTMSIIVYLNYQFQNIFIYFILIISFSQSCSPLGK